MIRLVVLGVTGLVALGAVAALGRSAAPPRSAAIAPEVVSYPVVSGIRGDRLPLIRKEDKKEELALAAPVATVTEPKPVPEAVVSTPAPARTKPKEPAFIPRHWHDTAAVVRKRSAAEPKAAQSRAVEKPKPNCNQDGLNPLLRKLNLQPNCEL